MRKRSVQIGRLQEHGDEHGHRRVDPSVSVIIPTKDKLELLQSCIDSIQKRTTYSNFEIVVVNNDSVEEETLKYLDGLPNQGVKVLDFPAEFNYSKICNFAASQVDADFLCFLNNDTEVLSPRWLSNLMDHAVQPDAAVIGSKLLFPNGHIQHLGIALDYLGVAGHAFSGMSTQDSRVSNLIGACFEVSAVTFACSLISKKLFLEHGGLDENFKIGLNDVEFCIRLRRFGKVNVLCTQSELIHHAYGTRPRMSSKKGFLIAASEIVRFLKLRQKQDIETYFYK